MFENNTQVFLINKSCNGIKKRYPFLLCWQNTYWPQVSVTSSIVHLPCANAGPRNAILASVLSHPMKNINPPTDSSASTSTPRKTGRFRPNWLQLYSWLQYDHRHHVMYCKICRKWTHENFASRTSFVEGNANFRLEIIHHHNKSKAHKFCVDRERGLTINEPVAENT